MRGRLVVTPRSRAEADDRASKVEVCGMTAPDLGSARKSAQFAQAAVEEPGCRVRRRLLAAAWQERGSTMNPTVNIREWRGHEVIDPDGHKVGTLESVYVDTSSDEPAMATVETGILSHHRLVFVPLAGSSVGPGQLRVAYSKTLVHECPSIGTDDILPADHEEAIFQHYGLPYQAGAGGERQLARR
jgi:hypothetical protein